MKSAIIIIVGVVLFLAVVFVPMVWNNRSQDQSFPPFKFFVGDTVKVNFPEGSIYKNCKSDKWTHVGAGQNYYNKSIKANKYTVYLLMCGLAPVYDLEVDESMLEKAE